MNNILCVLVASLLCIPEKRLKEALTTNSSVTGGLLVFIKKIVIV
jgi:hypothetical protein